jgi:DHA3 family tetracycline resistance protein-like MFS transporter
MPSFLSGLPPRLVYLAVSAVAALAFQLVVTVNLVYQVTVVGLSPLELVLVGTVLEAAAFAAELPTGVFADAAGRRVAVIAGYALVGAGFVLEASVPSFAAVVVAQVVWGTGWALTDGALEAWVADEVGEEQAAATFLRGAQVGQVAGLVGIGASVALGLVDVRVAMIAGGLVFIALAVALLSAMVETRPPARRGTGGTLPAVGAAARGMARLVRGSGALVAVLAAAAIAGGASEGYDRLWTPHVIDDVGVPALGGLPLVVWFGIVEAGSVLLSAGALELARRRLDLAAPPALARALVWVYGVLVLAVVTFALTTSFPLALAALWLGGALRATASPLTTAWLNSQLEPGVRATGLSLCGQADALGQLVCGPLLGVLAQTVSVPAAIAVSGLALVPVLLLYRLAAGPRAGTAPVPAA